MQTSPRRTRQSLKRSASQASLHSFPPTPPRTHRRRGRGRSRGSCDSDSDDAPLSDKDELPQIPEDKDHGTRKKRKLSNTKLDDEDEEAQFWGTGGTASNSKPADSKPSMSRSKKPLLYQRFKPQSATSSISSEQLVSPPPSHRKPAVAPAAPAPKTPTPAATLTLPVTPVRRSKRKTGGSLAGSQLLRDSASNPFIATPIEEADEEVESPSGLPQGDESPTPAYEKPMVTYVFRGVRRVYVNPMFNHEKNRPRTPPPNSRLPVEHPDYSPDPTCKPKLLFPEAHKKRKGKKAVALPSTPSPKRADDSDSEWEGPVTRSRGKTPMFAKPMLTLDAELKKAERKKPASKVSRSKVDDDDPFL